VHATEPATDTNSPADPSGLPALPCFCDPLFLMINTFETRPRPVHRPRPESHSSTISNSSRLRQPPWPLAHNFPDAAKFPLAAASSDGSRYTRLNLSRHLRHHRVQVAHAFDFYTIHADSAPSCSRARRDRQPSPTRRPHDPRNSRAQAAAFRWCDAVVCNSQAAAIASSTRPVAQ